MGTYATKAKDIDRRWFLVNADGLTLGRMASEVACLLRGKWNPLYAPYLDMGDHVIIVNAAKVKITGRKVEQKTYFRHSKHPGGVTIEKLSVRIKTEPDEVVRDAIYGMLPKGPLGRQMLRKLKIYRAGTHPHTAQQAIPVDLSGHGKTIPPRTPAVPVVAKS